MITLTDEERQHLNDLMHRGTAKARVQTRVRIVLKRAEGWSIARIAHAVEVSTATVSNTRKRYLQGGVVRVLQDRPPTPYHRALDAEGEAVLIEVACSPVPDGHFHWTLRMLRGTLIEIGVVAGISASTV